MEERKIDCLDKDMGELVRQNGPITEKQLKILEKKDIATSPYPFGSFIGYTYSYHKGHDNNWYGITNEGKEVILWDDRGEPILQQVEVWYAAGGEIMKAGPYATQVEAWKGLELTEKEQQLQGSIHPKDARVWPEYKQE